MHNTIYLLMSSLLFYFIMWKTLLRSNTLSEFGSQGEVNAMIMRNQSFRSYLDSGIFWLSWKTLFHFFVGCVSTLQNEFDIWFIQLEGVVTQFKEESMAHEGNSSTVVGTLVIFKHLSSHFVNLPPPKGRTMALFPGLHGWFLFYKQYGVLVI